eukprot:COSAG02_NODE_13873_length_1336_cov_14.654810_2_plen_152_part_00
MPVLCPLAATHPALRCALYVLPLNYAARSLHRVHCVDYIARADSGCVRTVRRRKGCSGCSAVQGSAGGRGAGCDEGCAALWPRTAWWRWRWRWRRRSYRTTRCSTMMTCHHHHRHSNVCKYRRVQMRAFAAQLYGNAIFCGSLRPYSLLEN